MSGRLEATEALVNSAFARKQQERGFYAIYVIDVNIIAQTQPHKCLPWISFFFFAVYRGRVGSLSALKDGNVRRSTAAGIKTLHSRALNFC